MSDARRKPLDTLSPNMFPVHTRYCTLLLLLLLLLHRQTHESKQSNERKRSHAKPCYPAFLSLTRSTMPASFLQASAADADAAAAALATATLSAHLSSALFRRHPLATSAGVEVSFSHNSSSYTTTALYSLPLSLLHEQQRRWSKWREIEGAQTGTHRTW